MNVLTLGFSVLLVGCASAAFPFKYEEGDRYFYFPDEDGKLHLVDAQAPVEDITYSDAASFWLYTRQNPRLSQRVTNEASILGSNFDASRETVFIVHGWTMSGYSSMNTDIRDAYLGIGDYNVFVVDWRSIAAGLYPSAASGAVTVGTDVGNFMITINRLGNPYSRMHLIGFSLGAHVVGVAGRTAGGQAQRITGLDPAGPLWLTNSNRLQPSDGRYVEVIHTNVYSLGFRDTLGDADFYPNGGANQPGCYYIDVCSHNRAYELFIESVRTMNFVARSCGTVTAAISEVCLGSNRLYMGGSLLSKTGSGIFHLSTNRRSPFAQG